MELKQTPICQKLLYESIYTDRVMIGMLFITSFVIKERDNGLHHIIIIVMSMRNSMVDSCFEKQKPLWNTTKKKDIILGTRKRQQKCVFHKRGSCSANGNDLVVRIGQLSNLFSENAAMPFENTSDIDHKRKCMLNSSCGMNSANGTNTNKQGIFWARKKL
jgi:hypothetical protein